MKTLLGLTILVFALGFIPSERRKEKAPPGTVRLNDTLFIDATEVANMHWREFTQAWILGIKHDTALYEEMMPDTSVWSSLLNGKYSPFASFYHEHPSYNNYPVIGVSYEQAVAFCKWRSDRVNELYSMKPELNPFPNKRYAYRLPKESEWELAASSKLNIDSFPFGRISMFDKKWGNLANTKTDKVVYEGEHVMKEKLFYHNANNIFL